MLIADDLAVAPDGVVYFSDASTKFTLLEAYYDHVEAGANGRVIRYDPKTGMIEREREREQWRIQGGAQGAWAPPLKISTLV